MKILVCNESYPDVIEKMSAALPAHQIRTCSPLKVKENLDGIDIVVPSIARIDRQIVNEGQFGFIQQMGVGLDSIDVAAAEQCGVWVSNIPGKESGNTDSVAELAMLLILALSRRLYKAKAILEAGGFGEPASHSLIGKTVCIVGLGDIGKSLARKLQGFDCRLIAVREHAERGASPELRIEQVFSTINLNDAIAQSDYVVICLPYSNASHHLFNSERFSVMKRGSFLINVARGGIVDTTALCQALATGTLAGAGLDVFENEPVDPKAPLFQYNVVATPHVGGHTDASVSGVARLMLENIMRFTRGEKPQYTMNSPTHIRKPQPTRS